MPPKWVKITDTSGTHPRPRHGHRAVAIKELIVVFGGGNGGVIDELFVFNTEKNHWFQPAVKGDIPSGRAAFGIVVDKTRIITYGGMIEYGHYSNDMYELQASRWEWKKLRPRPPRDNKPNPLPRLGHTFTLIQNKVYLFGGLALDDFTGGERSLEFPRYLNDLYTLELHLNNSVSWDIPVTFGSPPHPRESHSAIAHQGSDGQYRLIIYGGMAGSRLGDLWVLELGSMTWSKIITFGPQPYPRSLHTATVVDNKMYIFGGWIPISSEESRHTIDEKEWKVTNQLACLDLMTFEWDILSGNSPEEMPKARAGHCAVAMNGRVYLWSGRDGYRKAWNNQVCCSDFWYLEVSRPSAVGRPLLIKGETNSLKLSWTPLPSVEHYLLQIQQYEPTIISKSIECQKTTPVVKETSIDNHKEIPADNGAKATEPKPTGITSSTPVPVKQPSITPIIRTCGFVRQSVPRSQIVFQKPGVPAYSQLVIRNLQGRTYPMPQVPRGVLPMRPVGPVRAFLKLATTSDPKNPQAARSTTLVGSMLPRNVIPLNQIQSQSSPKRTVLFNKPGIKLVTIKNENQIKLISSGRSSGESSSKVEEGISDSVSQMIQNTNQQAFQNVLVPLNEAMMDSETLTKKPNLEMNTGKIGTQPPKVSLSQKEGYVAMSSPNVPHACKDSEGGPTYIQLQPAGNYSKEMIRALPTAQPESVSPMQLGHNLKLIKKPVAKFPMDPPTMLVKTKVSKVPTNSFVSTKIERPISPNTIKIKRDSTGGAVISWQPLPEQYNITEYTVILNVKRDIHPSGRKVVYTGSHTQASIPMSVLEEAEIDNPGGSKIVTFHISATNTHGTSPPIIICWRLQSPTAEIPT